MEDDHFLSRSFETRSTPPLFATIAFVVIHEIVRLNSHDDMDRIERPIEIKYYSGGIHQYKELSHRLCKIFEI
jgi:hypothetical protein